MKRKFLEDLGIEKEMIDKIMDENGKDIEAAKADTDALKTKTDDLEKEISGYKTQISDRDKQLEKLKKSENSTDELKKQIEELEASNKEATKTHDAEIRQLKIDAAVDKALSASRSKNNAAVRALLDLSDAKLGEDGTVIGLKDQISKLTKADDSKFLFDDGKPRLKGAAPGEGSDPDPKAVTQEQFSKMGYQDRSDLFESNKDLYEELSKAEAGE